jgi:hypothetical protein
LILKLLTIIDNRGKNIGFEALKRIFPEYHSFDFANSYFKIGSLLFSKFFSEGFK